MSRKVDRQLDVANRTDSPYGTDYVTSSGVLYCSIACAVEDGRDVDEIRPLESREYEQTRYGALCPVCEGEYAGFLS